MSIDWPFKSKDLKRTIDDLEKILELKDVENKQKKEEINFIISKLEANKNKIRDIISKLEYAEGELYDLNKELGKINSEILILQKDISELNNDKLMKEEKITYLHSVKINLEKKNYLKENQILGMKDLKSEKLIKMIKDILFQKGFLSKKEFEDLKKKI